MKKSPENFSFLHFHPLPFLLLLLLDSFWLLVPPVVHRQLHPHQTPPPCFHFTLRNGNSGTQCVDSGIGGMPGANVVHWLVDFNGEKR